MFTLTNIAEAQGTYNGLSTEMTSEAVVTQLIDDLTISKTADRTSWVNGDLTYTIVVDNQTALPFENPVITDTIDPALATLVADSITINGVAADPADYTFDAVTGLLTITLTEVAATSTTTIVFKVKRV